MGKERVNKGTLGQSGRIRAPRPLLALGAVFLLALGAAALASANGSATHGSGPLGKQWWLFAAVTLGGGIMSLFRLRERISATDPASTARGRLNRGVLAVAAVLTAAVPIALFLVRTQPSSNQTACVTQCINVLRTGGATAAHSVPSIPGNTTATHHAFKLPLSLILLIIGIALALVVAAAVVALVVRLRRTGIPSGIAGAPPPALAEEAEDESALGAAVLAGRDALEGEARAAIIACYAAMEDSLARAGVPRLESDSPSDLLARATRRGFVDGPAPRLLARLFREARFSTHPMQARHLDEARGALDAILEQLTARQQAESNGAGPNSSGSNSAGSNSSGSHSATESADAAAGAGA